MPRLPLLMLLAIAVPRISPAQDGDAGLGQRLFVQNCARCHGPEGRGDGPTQVFPPARNFREGGFSFGYTEEAVMRTIAQGIPGTAMTPFEGVLGDEDRRALARHVLSLVPAEARREEDRARVAVGDRAVFVRGYLPPPVPGAACRPRGLVTGLPGGLSFAHDLESGRLLEVRRGPFVRRSDWSGRGGTPLELEGARLVAFPAGGAPWSLRGPFGRTPLSVRFGGTEAVGIRARLRFDLAADGGRTTPARLVEELALADVRDAVGFVRRFQVTAGPAPLALAATVLPEAKASWKEEGAPAAALAGPARRMPFEGSRWIVAAPAEGAALAVRFEAAAGGALHLEGDEVVLALDVPAGATVHAAVAVLLVAAWNDAARERLELDLAF